MKAEETTVNLDDAKYSIIEKLFQTICRIPGITLRIKFDEELSYPVEAEDEENIGFLLKDKKSLGFIIEVHKD